MSLNNKERISEINQEIAKLNPDIGGTSLAWSDYHAKKAALKVAEQDFRLKGKDKQNEIDALYDGIQKKQQEIQSCGVNAATMHTIAGKMKSLEADINKINQLMMEQKIIISKIKKAEEESKIWEKIRDLLNERDELYNPAHLFAYQRNPNPTGRSLALVDLLHHLVDSESYQKWRDDFCEKNNCSVNSDNGNKLQFIPNNKNSPAITVEKNSVSMPIATSSPEEILSASQLFVEVYLNCIKGMNIYGHKITSPSDEVLSCLVSTLATALDRLGDHSEVLINGKMVSVIMADKSKNLGGEMDILPIDSVGHDENHPGFRP